MFVCVVPSSQPSSRDLVYPLLGCFVCEKSSIYKKHTHTRASLRLIAIWRTVITLAITLTSLRDITVKLWLVPIFKLFARINFREFYQFAKVYARESLCARKFLCVKLKFSDLSFFNNRAQISTTRLR